LPRDTEGSPFLPTPHLITPLKDKKIISVSCGEAHTLVLTDEGYAYSFGACSCGNE